MSIYNDAINTGAKKLVTDIRALVDDAYEYVEADDGLTNEEKALVMVEFHNNYQRNNTLMTELMKIYKSAAEEPEPEP